MIYREHLEELKKAQWPKCDQLAEQIAQLPAPADTLEAATKSRIHHVRSAALKALAKIDRSRAIKVAERLLTDVSYEVRMDAEAIVGPCKKGAGARTKFAKPTSVDAAGEENHRRKHP
jgi:HEAT repeat protein